MMSRLFVVIATIGRAEVVCDTVAWLDRQSRRPDGIVVATVTPGDVTGVAELPSKPEILYSEKGLCRQRNRALDALQGRADIVVFFDDDFVPSPQYLEQVEAMFDRNPHVVGATGRLIADGIHGAGYSFAEAVALVAADHPPDPPSRRPAEALYGCNMAIRTAAAQDMRFDEALPLYGWLEDIDFTYRLAKRGSLMRSQSFAGVHMGTRSGRSPGRRLGYSQIANPVYLLRKHAVPPHLARRLMFQNLASNLVGSFRRVGEIDRRGRLSGNVKAIWDLVRGRLDPQRILAL